MTLNQSPESQPPSSPAPIEPKRAPIDYFAYALGLACMERDRLAKKNCELIQETKP